MVLSISMLKGCADMLEVKAMNSIHPFCFSIATAQAADLSLSRSSFPNMSQTTDQFLYFLVTLVNFSMWKELCSKNWIIYDHPTPKSVVFSIFFWLLFANSLSPVTDPFHSHMNHVYVVRGVFLITWRQVQMHSSQNPRFVINLIWCIRVIADIKFIFTFSSFQLDEYSSVSVVAPCVHHYLVLWRVWTEQKDFCCIRWGLSFWASATKV